IRRPPVTYSDCAVQQQLTCGGASCVSSVSVGRLPPFPSHTLTADECSEQFQLLSLEMVKLSMTLCEVAMTLWQPGKTTQERILLYFGGQRAMETVANRDRP